MFFLYQFLKYIFIHHISQFFFFFRFMEKRNWKYTWIWNRPAKGFKRKGRRFFKCLRKNGENELFYKFIYLYRKLTLSSWNTAIFFLLKYENNFKWANHIIYLGKKKINSKIRFNLYSKISKSKLKNKISIVTQNFARFFPFLMETLITPFQYNLWSQ